MRPFWNGRLKPPQRCRTLAAMPQLPDGLSGWSASPKRRMSVWMPPVKTPHQEGSEKERVFDEGTGKGKTRLYFEDELKVPKGQSKLQFEADKTVRKVGDTLASGIHGKIHEVEQENSGVEAAHKQRLPQSLLSATTSTTRNEARTSPSRRCPSWNKRPRPLTGSSILRRRSPKILR